VNGFVFRQSFRAQHAGIDWVGRVAAHANSATVLDADEHPASDRAVPACRRDPAVRDAARRRVPGGLVDRKRIAIGQRVETEYPLEIQAASLPRYGAAGCFGTALMKKRYLPMISPASASPNAAQSNSAFDVKRGNATAPSASSTPRAMKGRRNVVASRRDD